jgi:hypothetical protein
MWDEVSAISMVYESMSHTRTSAGCQLQLLKNTLAEANDTLQAREHQLVLANCALSRLAAERDGLQVVGQTGQLC